MRMRCRRSAQRASASEEISAACRARRWRGAKEQALKIEQYPRDRRRAANGAGRRTQSGYDCTQNGNGAGERYYVGGRVDG